MDVKRWITCGDGGCVCVAWQGPISPVPSFTFNRWSRGCVENFAAASAAVAVVVAGVVVVAAAAAVATVAAAN